MMGLIDTDSVITIQSFDDGKYTEKQITVGEFIKQYTKKGEVPTVDPVKHGHWIEGVEALRYDGVLDDDYIVCSVCNKPFNILDNCTELFDYCPNCGALMDEDGD